MVEPLTLRKIRSGCPEIKRNRFLRIAMKCYGSQYDFTIFLKIQPQYEGMNRT